MVYALGLDCTRAIAWQQRRLKFDDEAAERELSGH